MKFHPMEKKMLKLYVLNLQTNEFFIQNISIQSQIASHLLSYKISSIEYQFFAISLFSRLSHLYASQNSSCNVEQPKRLISEENGSRL